jgi:acetyl esterase/lipase
MAGNATFTKSQSKIYWFLPVFIFFINCVNSSTQEGEVQPPSGYWNETTMKIAYGLGTLKLIDRNPAIPEDIIAIENVIYKTVDTISLALDIYHAKAVGNHPKPALVFVHGGAWKSGKRGDYLPYLIDYARKGYVAITVSYRLSRVAIFPAAVQDVNCAVRWVKANAANHGIDPERIVLIGGSAGGHLSMMVGYGGSEALFQEDCPYDEGSTVQAIVNLYGPADLTSDEAKGRNEPVSFLGSTYEDDPSVYEKASPRFYITSEAPPTLIFHGTIDTVVPVSQSDSLAVWLKEAGVPYEYHRLKGWPHTMDLAVRVNAYCQHYIDAFLEEYL